MKLKSLARTGILEKIQRTSVEVWTSFHVQVMDATDHERVVSFLTVFLKHSLLRKFAFNLGRRHYRWNNIRDISGTAQSYNSCALRHICTVKRNQRQYLVLKEMKELRITSFCSRLEAPAAGKGQHHELRWGLQQSQASATLPRTERLLALGGAEAHWRLLHPHQQHQHRRDKVSTRCKKNGHSNDPKHKYVDMWGCTE